MRKFAIALAPIVAAFVAIVGFAVAAAPGPDYLDVTSWQAVAKSKGTVRLSATTKAGIPRHPDGFIRSNPVVGIAWADLQTAKAFVVTIHPAIGRDSHQNPRAWHAHTAQLTAGATAPNDFCLGAITSSPTAGIAIQGATVTINTRASVLPVATSAFDVAAGFTVQADPACASRLGVRLST
jgi:hypothetical protein